MSQDEYLLKAQQAASALNLNFAELPYSLEDLATGIEVEEEHGSISPSTNVTDDDNIKTAKIALVHLNERADYYERLHYVEHGSPLFWSMAPLFTNAIIIIILLVVIIALVFRIGHPKPVNPLEFIRAGPQARTYQKQNQVRI
jgi:hypothetical protein